MLASIVSRIDTPYSRGGAPSGESWIRPWYRYTSARGHLSVADPTEAPSTLLYSVQVKINHRAGALVGSTPPPAKNPRSAHGEIVWHSFCFGIYIISGGSRNFQRGRQPVGGDNQHHQWRIQEFPEGRQPVGGDNRLFDQFFPHRNFGLEGHPLPLDQPLYRSILKYEVRRVEAP